MSDGLLGKNGAPPRTAAPEGPATMPRSHHPRRFRDDVDAADFRTACEMFRGGDGYDKIAALLHRDPKTVAAWVSGLKRGARNWKLGSQAEIDAARSFAAQGVTLMEIAELLERAPATVDWWISHPEYSAPDPVDTRIKRARDLRDKRGLTQAQIGSELGVSASTVGRLLQKADGRS